MSAEISKDEKERQLDAKIAAIRAKNESKLQRQREVEKDRKQAEKQNQSITTAPRLKSSTEEYQEPHFNSGGDKSNKLRPARRSREDSCNEKKDKKGSGRLRDGDGPPPDPGYRFLADRMRDGSESDESDDGTGKKKEVMRRREDQPTWARGGRGGGGGDRGAGRGRGVRGGRGGPGGGEVRGERSRAAPDTRWTADHDRRDDWEAETRNNRGGRGGGRGGRGGRGGGGSGGGGSYNRNRDAERTDNFIREMRKNSDNERSFARKETQHPLMRNSESSEWNGKPQPVRGEKQSPRHKPRPLLERGGGGEDWCDQMEEWESQPLPTVPTALVSPRKVEEPSRPGGTRPAAAVSNGPSSPSRGGGSRQRAETNHPYGVEPPPFKENVRPQPAPLLQTEVGFSQHPSQYNKPFSHDPVTHPPVTAPSTGWKCPDPGCKQVNGPNRNNCSKCGISFKAANDYINNYACEKVKAEYSNYSAPSPGTQVSTATTQSNGFQSSSNPSIPQPMLAQSNIKDWNVDVDQSNWSATAQPLTTSIDSWGNLDPNMIYTTIDPGMQYGMMVPSFPPPFYNQPQPFYPPGNSEYFPGSSDFTPGYQQTTVFNPTAQMFLPPADQLQTHIYKAPPPGPPFSNNQKQNFPSAKPYQDSDPNLMISLNKPPNPLSLRRPQQSSKLQERLNQNRQSQDRERAPAPAMRSNGDLQVSRGSGRLQKHRDPQHKPPSMVEMQSGVLKKGVIPPPPPGKGNGLLILGSTQVDESFLSEEINIPVKFLACPKLDIFKEKAILVNPSRDWLVLVNGLGNDARIIAMTNKSDVDKANDADNVANDLCDIIENKILGLAGHICVLVSMLLPRIDLQEAQGMGNPNNVRKVINVQITQRLYENPRVTLMNSDKILDWGDNDVLLNQLIRPDGFSLSERGALLVYNNWIDHIKKRMKDSNYVPNSQKQTNQLNPIKREDSIPEKDSAKQDKLASQGNGDISKVAAEEDDTVTDPFGSYEAPPVLVSRPRTTSTSGPQQEDPEVDDDALPNLEPVNKLISEEISDLGKKITSISVEEPLGKNGVEFDDLEDGGFIEDNYCGAEPADKNDATLPSMMSLGPSEDDAKVSGHFLEDSYLPAEQSLAARRTIELTFEHSSPVKIGGDFNNWEPQEMEKSGNHWTFLVDLPEGKYQYKYYVSGEWILDENKPACEKDGIRNNVLEIIC